MEIDSKRLIASFVNKTATLTERQNLATFISENPARFDLVLEKLRERAMIEMGLDPNSDFLPEHIRHCVPSAKDHIFDKSAPMSAAMPSPAPLGAAANAAGSFMSGISHIAHIMFKTKSAAPVYSANRQQPQPKSTLELLRSEIFDCETE